MSGLVRLGGASPGHSQANQPEHGRPTAAGAGDLETLVAAEPDLESEDTASETDSSGIVEQAELLLRESAPHDFEVLIVGGGTGGCAAALRAAQLGARVGLIDTPVGQFASGEGFRAATQSLLETAHFLRDLRGARQRGVTATGEFVADFEAVMARKDDFVAQQRAETVAELTRNHVEMVTGYARFVAEHTVEIDSPDAGTRRLTAVQLVIAVGNTTRPDSLPGDDSRRILPLDAATTLRQLPGSIAILGSDPAAVEIAYLYHQLGARVTLLVEAPSLLPEDDPDVGDLLMGQLVASGITVAVGVGLQEMNSHQATLEIAYLREGVRQLIGAEIAFIGGPRSVDSPGLGLERAGIAMQEGYIAVDRHSETSTSGVFAVGDCIRGHRWPQRALAEGRMVAELILSRPLSVDLRHVPRYCRTRPETATVGHTMQTAKEAGIAARVGIASFADNQKAMAGLEANGFVKVVVDSQSQRLIGCQIIGPGASEIINQAVLALNAGETIDGLAAAVYGYPTLGQAFTAAAWNARKSA